MTSRTPEYFRGLGIREPEAFDRAFDRAFPSSQRVRDQWAIDKRTVDAFCAQHEMTLVTKRDRDWAEMLLLLSKQQSEIEKLLSLLTAPPAVIPVPAGYRKVEPPAPSPVAHALDVMDRPRSLRTPIGMEPILPADFDRG
jgi:hypothetical protein